MHAHIQCNVSNCKYNSSHNCSLTDIVVGNTTPQACCKADTECDSFENK